MSWRVSAIFVVLGVLVGVFFAAQLRTEVPLDGSFAADQIQARNRLIKTFVDEQGLLQNQIASLRNDISDQQKKNEKLFSTKRLSYLDSLKEQAGVTSITGEGVIITINDAPGANREQTGVILDALVQASDLRDIVNVLRASAASAIAINNQRVLPTTSIVAVGNSILVNNFYITAPFTISAVGDMSFITQRLRDKTILDGLKKRIAQYKISFDLSTRSHITVTPYTADFRLKYVTTTP